MVELVVGMCLDYIVASVVGLAGDVVEVVACVVDVDIDFEHSVEGIAGDCEYFAAGMEELNVLESPIPCDCPTFLRHKMAHDLKPLN